MPNYTPIIGMEVHVELKTASKMFCSCKNDPDREAPNTNVCEICLAHPGTLPLPNQKAIEWTVKIAKALGCKINEQSKFDRKHYFYPDLPKGYQISQYDEPIGEHGEITVDLVGGKNPRTEATIGITRVHLEEDTAKLSHDKTGNTLVDFNRAGVPLVEIVTDPDIQTGIEAKAYCQELQTVFRYLGVSEADMEKGHMRCEANISLQETDKFDIKDGLVIPKDGYALNHKVELKNINSFRAVEKAIDYEIKRQTEMLEKGETWQQQTRGWDEDKGETILQRVKETAADYRYFPEPDIPPFNPLQVARDTSLPELPNVKRVRFNTEYGFSLADSQLLTNDEHWADYAEHTMNELVEWLHSLPESKEDTDDLQETKKQQTARLAGGWLTSKLMGAMAERKIDIRVLKIKPENFAELIALIYTNRVNSTNAQKILVEMLEAGTDKDPTHIMEEKGYGQINDEGKLNLVIDEVIKNYPEQVAAFRAGKEPILQFLKGMAMKATEGSADPVVIEKLLREKLSQ
ncbi:MAG TPA: Asp-tRNA(Asn)/Glu-tRNA(Gln) amidotransferase subunit GatB [Patescibacteria group bacterium]|nr:Asp-tRNA(Asn)/Glu-tRNA(Gln) amidotransferase subunit GatB [Patescibacteria group bacterium]